MKRITRIKKQSLLLTRNLQGEVIIDLRWKYHVISATDAVLLSTNDFHQAWMRIRGKNHGCRLVRNDGDLLAYASTISGGRISKGFPDKVSFIGTLIKKAVSVKKTASKKAAAARATAKKKKVAPKKVTPEALKKSPKKATAKKSRKK